MSRSYDFGRASHLLQGCWYSWSIFLGMSRRVSGPQEKDLVLKGFESAPSLGKLRRKAEGKSWCWCSVQGPEGADNGKCFCSLVFCSGAIPSWVQGWQLARALCQLLGGDWRSCWGWKESAEFHSIWGSTGGPVGFQLWSLSHRGLWLGCFGYVAERRAFLVLGHDRGHPHLFWSLMSHCLKSWRRLWKASRRHHSNLHDFHMVHTRILMKITHMCLGLWFTKEGIRDVLTTSWVSVYKPLNTA